MAEVKALQSRLASSLKEVGYEGSVGTLPVSLEQNKKLRRFVEMVTEHTKPDNYLNPGEARSFQNLKSAGQVIAGRPLEDALESLGHSVERARDVEKEVTNTEDKIAHLKKQLQALNSVQKSLSDHYASLLHSHDELTRQKSDMLRQQHSTRARAEEGNRQVDAALQDLMVSVRDLCSFHRADHEGAVEKDEAVAAARTRARAAVPPKFLFEVSQDAFHQAEDEYLKELTAYTKKQFFKGLADSAYSCAPGEEETKFAEVDLGDADQAILRGVTEEQHSKHCQELARLQAVYPLTQVEYISAELSKRHAEAASSQAKRELEVLQGQHVDSCDCEALSQQSAETQRRIEALRAQVQELGRTRLTSLLQDMAALQVSRVLHGDYDLKIARQDYFTSKQDKVISDLQTQRSRHELLSILYEVELRKHRDTHRLLGTAERQLTQLKEEGEKRSVAMKNPSLSPSNAPSMDAFTGRLCSALDVKPREDAGECMASVVSHADLRQAAKQLVHQIATLQGVLFTNHAEMAQICQKQELVTGELEKEVFGTASARGAADGPKLTVEEYSKLCSDLATLVGTLEKNIKGLLKDYDGKKKMLQANSLLQRERDLFVYFFTSPDRLSSIVSDLAKRVDSIALAKK